MTFLLRRHADLPVTPWKNGGGRTRELYLRAGQDGSPRVRVSMAEVASDGPFSAYPGVARTLTVLTGDPLALVVAGLPMTLARREVLRFDGGVDTTCALTGAAVEDLGVMVWPDGDRPAAHADIEFVAADEVRPDASVLVLVVAGEGVRCGEESLAVGDALVRADGVRDEAQPPAEALRGRGVVAVVREH